ncbi:MAG: hypothetical protein RLZZ365_1188 [Pseudomonadota bacterium]|jgi:predicted Fe-S protein YdhL (DUF1289 family)
MIRNSDGSIGSPCVSWCEMNPKSNYCFGCFRSIEEIASWSNLSEAEKEAIWLALPLREATENSID